ncbi:MAG: VWA domain-containing protein [Gammaproteobacteria bacterium]|nr:VWA domain-containing protein [Gammaproteobacteria bacterium]
MRKRRGVEEFSVSFLDVICCGFGAIILLLMLTKTFQPEVLEVSSVDLTEQVQQREAALFEIRGKISELRRQIQLENSDLQSKLVELAELQTQLTKVLGRFDNLAAAEREISLENQQLASARQSLTDEMERLLGLDFRRDSGLVGGISVDSEYIIFVIDTSGSMQSAAWGQAVQKVSETLAIYPNVKGIQVMNDMGDYKFPAFARQWIEDSPSRRSNIVNTLRNWAPFSNSSPVEGIEEAVSAFYDPNKRISVYVFGDDYTGNSIEEVVEAVDRINLADESGRRRVRIHAVGFPVFLDRPNARTFRYAALMRELAYRNDGTFVGLTQYQ